MRGQRYLVNCIVWIIALAVVEFVESRTAGIIAILCAMIFWMVNFYIAVSDEEIIDREVKRRVAEIERKRQDIIRENANRVPRRTSSPTAHRT